MLGIGSIFAREMTSGDIFCLRKPTCTILWRGFHRSHWNCHLACPFVCLSRLRIWLLRPSLLRPTVLCRTFFSCDEQLYTGFFECCISLSQDFCRKISNKVCIISSQLRQALQVYLFTYASIGIGLVKNQFAACLTYLLFWWSGGLFFTD